MNAALSSLQAALLRQRRGAQWRAGAIVFALSAPIVAAELAWLLRAAALIWALIFGVLAVVAIIVFAWRRANRYNLERQLRHFDAEVPEFEDSAALAIAADVAPGTIGALQQQKIRSRLIQRATDQTLPALAPAWPWRTQWLCLSVAVTIAVLAVTWPTLQPGLHADEQSQGAATALADAAVTGSLRYTPPAYTGLGAQQVDGLDAKLPADSRVQWTLRVGASARAVSLRFHDDSVLALTPDHGAWRGERLIAASQLYRVEVDGVAQPALSRIDVIADAPPVIKVLAPTQTLTIIDGATAPKDWSFDFDVSDDYGLGAAALSVTHTQGSGEQVKVSTQMIPFETVTSRSHRYRRTIDLKALDFARGDDVIVRFEVADNRVPMANTSTSPSFILRWLPEGSSDSVGIEGVVQKTLPAYFRSERQIIIDTEALQAQRGALPAARFARQADELGVDQKVLRLRYGQFLGEGFESNAEHAPGVDADAAANGAAPSLAQAPGEAEPATSGAAQGFGRDEDVLHEFGHAHDIAEAATLLDPETRRILKLALNEMWQAELHLRQAEPEAALPYEYKALDYIKQVQQAERIYLARTGLELPQVDLSRRLSGDRKGLDDRGAPLPAAEGADPALQQFWTALAQDRNPDLAALTTWLRGHADAPDALGLAAAVDRLRRDPDCGACRSELRDRFWPLLPTPPTAARARPAPDAAGRLWLGAQQEAR